MDAKLKADFPKRLVSAKIASEWSKRIVLVMLARNVRTVNEGERLTTMPIQGNVVCDYAWERWRKNGVTFRTLAAFQHGKRIPIPANLRKGY